MVSPFKSLTEASEAFAELTATHETTLVQLASAESSRDAIQVDLDTAKASGVSALAERDAALADVTRLTGELTAASTAATEAKDKLTAYTNGETARINAEVTRTLAAGGHRPIAMGVDNDPNADPAKNKAALTARQKVSAGIAAQFPNK